MAYVELNGVKTHVTDMGPKTAGADGGLLPVIMIHGLFTNQSVFYFTSAHELAKHRRVVLYDLRSHGLTDRSDEGYTLDILSKDLIALMDTLGIERADLTGYSYGGAVALYTAIHHSDRVGRLALIEAPLFGEAANEQFLTGNVEDIMAHYVKSASAAVSESRINKLKKQRDVLFTEDMLAKAFREGKSFFERVAFGQVDMPTLLLYGKRSPLMDTGKRLAKSIPGAKLEACRGDHNLPVQKPGWMTRKLGQFFAI